MPKSLDAYYDEAGRAGRDGRDAECILYYNFGDKSKIDDLVHKDLSPDERESYSKVNKYYSSIDCNSGNGKHG